LHPRAAAGDPASARSNSCFQPDSRVSIPLAGESYPRATSDYHYLQLWYSQAAENSMAREKLKKGVPQGLKPTFIFSYLRHD
jgi:hypothetical protein